MNLPYFDLRDKVAIISGGATGIGQGIAEGLAEAGAQIVIAARRVELCEEACRKIGEKTGVRTLPHRCDVSNTDEIETLVSDVIREMGQIDILVNNAGIRGSTKTILNMSMGDWDDVLNTNLKGVFMLSQAVVRRMVERGKGGKIINVGSIGSVIGLHSLSAYCASKGGCLQLTKVMALEWVRYNIQVNAILPGYFDTAFGTEFFSSDAGKKLLNNIPMRKLGQVEDIKGSAILLASRASDFMTGSGIVIDGGHSSW
jgi:NAD(P)-dependent dehydrogenase (short-subunit alcohol dehydrogenase family)